MGIRETLNRNPSIATGTTLAIIVIAVAFIVYSYSQGGASSAKQPTKAFFSVDDGKNWFEDDIAKLPPFDHEGKEAVRVMLFRCGNGKPFAGYLERYTAEVKKQLEEARSASTGPGGKAPARSPQDIASLAVIMKMGKEIKKPGDATWTKIMDEQNRTKVMQVKCPEGQNDVPAPVTP